MPRYRTVDTASAFIGWGRLGQTVEVQVLTFEPAGATDPNGNKVPRVVGTLVADADNYKDLSSGDPKLVRLKAGEQVTVDGTIENLRRGLLLAEPRRGDFVRMTFEDTYDTGRRGESKGKVIKVEHAPGDGEGSVSEDEL